MGLTRPKAVQIDFDVTNITDPLIRINSGESGSADKDAGIVIERGSDANVALMWDESADQFAFINTSETGTTAGNVTVSSYADLKANDITANDDLMVGDYIWFTADDKSTYYGVDSDVRLTHDHNRGLILKQRQTTADTPAIFTLQSTEASITVGERLGVIDFQTPNEASGTDAILVAAGIEAVAEGTFAADNNATKLSFKTAASETATEKASLSSAGLFTATSIDATVLTGALPAIDGSNLTGVGSSVGGNSGVDFNDSVKARFGTGNDLEIYHDGSDSYIHDTGTGYLLIKGSQVVAIQSANADAMITAQAGNDIKLYYDGSQKFNTSSTGATVTGTLAATAVTGDGSGLTSLPAQTFSGLTGTTVSSSDPAADTNPSAVGHLWVNSSSGETYVATNVTSNSNIWTNVGEGSGGVALSTINYLVIAGGGGGGFDNSGGGGAGGYRNSYNDEASGGGGSAEGSISNPSGSYTVTIGGGGSGETSSPSSRGDNGSNSVFGSITSTGGGGGGSDANNVAGSGSNGGSGGGGAQGGNSAPGGSGTANQGYDGGDGNNAPAGGGGGAGAVGADGGTGTGGVGVASTITGSSVYRGGGGGAGGSNASASGGNGGGGDGSNASGGGSYKAEHGTANTGGGGGGAGSSSAWGSNGGSGVVILRVQTSNYTGTTSGSPTVTTSGSDTIMTFTGSGSYTA